ncbi:MAG: methyl-accepting chemotaxis protein, partial [Clostridiales bacterium]|nr:methyl-accepting chemotaxis protein [Clostridiales bacterium]
TEQASSIEELSASINEIAVQVKENADNVNTATKYVNETIDVIVESTNEMNNMLAAMNDINNSSNEIAKIIKVIDDIAFQTNILALNAAVEAARAGTAGKGFAVVADEVRNLALKSADAAKQTTALIENSIATVQHGSSLAEKAAGSLEVVATKSNLVGETIEHVLVASNEQAQSIEQINTGVEQISSVVQTNSATAEESAAASEELSGQADMLKNLVSEFRLKNSRNRKPSSLASPKHIDFPKIDLGENDKY